MTFVQHADATFARLVGVLKLRPLLSATIFIALIKTIEFLADSRLIFFADSAAYLWNTINLHFHTTWPFASFSHLGSNSLIWPTRSLVYGWTLRALAAPFHSLSMVVALQMAMGAGSSWLLFACLTRFFHVRFSTALLLAGLFAVDPAQVTDEHLVMTEAFAMLAVAAYLTVALLYMRSRNVWLLLALAALGVLQVSLRFVYIPVVHVMAIAVPALTFFPWRGGYMSWRAFVLSLAVSIGSTLMLQSAYRHLVGYVVDFPPAYYYQSGFFLLGNLSPIIQPEDTDNPQVADAIRYEQQSAWPLRRELRSYQMWAPDGLVRRTLAIYQDTLTMDRASQRIALHAVRRDPLAFFKLGLGTYSDFWRDLRVLPHMVDTENGQTEPGPTISHLGDQQISMIFGGANVEDGHGLRTPTRRYDSLLRWWTLFLIVAWPFLVGLPLLLRPPNPRGVLLLFVAGGFLMVATCYGGEAVYRYFHPYSWFGIASIGIAMEAWRRRHTYRLMAQPA